MMDSSETSAFDFFEPLPALPEDATQDEEDELNDLIDEQLEIFKTFLLDILPDNLYYFKNLMIPFDDEEEEDELSGAETVDGDDDGATQDSTETESDEL